MRDIRSQFDDYIEGSNQLYQWANEIRCAYESGKKINKTKYNKILNMADARREKARELLGIINSHPRSRYMTCMPPITLR